MNKPKALLLTLCASLALGANADSIFGWFGKSAGDDGKANTVGNPSAKIQQTVFNINNRLISDVSSVSVIDAKGKVIYSNSFLCKSGSTCALTLTNIPLNSNLTLKFFDSKKELVGAYLISRISEVNSAILDETWLGVYVFNQMVKTSKQKPLELNSKLTKAFAGFSSPDNTPDIFEELGMYFIIQKGGVNEAKFYNELVHKLDTNQLLMVSKTTKATNKNISKNVSVKAVNLSQKVAQSAPQENKNICDQTVRSALGYVEDLAGFIPVVGDAFSAVLGTGQNILNDACPDPMDPDVAKKFAEIDAKLGLIDTELNALNYTVANIQKVIAQNETKGTLSDMYDNEHNLKSLYLDKYTGLTSSSNLDTYVKENGKLKKAFDSANVHDLLTNLPNQITSFEDLINDTKMKDLKSQLDSVCRVTSVAGDLIGTRISCDMAISRIAFTYSANAIKMKAMLNDEITTIANAVKSGNVDNSWLKANISETFNYNGQTATWDKASDIVNKIIDDKIKFMNDTLIGDNGIKLYKPLDGLSETLQQNIKAAQCSSGSLPAIKEWHTIHEYDASNKTPYIVTECDDGTGNKVTSKYYYNQRGTTVVDDKVMNAMGVLVPDRFFHGGDKNNYGYAPAFPWTNDSFITASTNPNKYYSDHQFKGYFNIPTGNAKSYVIGFDPASYPQVTLLPNTGNNTSSQVAFKEESSGVFVTTYIFPAKSSDFFTILRYTKGTYTYAWVMRTWGAYEAGGAFSDYKYTLLGAMQCITNDCNINNTGSSLDQVTFIDGTKIDWTKNEQDKTIPVRTTYSDYTINVK